MGFAAFGLLTPPALLVLLVALERYEDLVFPPVGDEPEASDGGGEQGSGDGRDARDGE